MWSRHLIVASCFAVVEASLRLVLNVSTLPSRGPCKQSAQSEEGRKLRVAVIGGGPAGASTADALAQALQGTRAADVQYSSYRGTLNVALLQLGLSLSLSLSLALFAPPPSLSVSRRSAARSES